MAETVTIPGIEIFQTGTYNGDNYGPSDLKDMIDAAPQVGFQPPVKLGHMGDADTKALLKKEGLPAFGYVSNLRIKGKKIIADLVDVPKRLGEIIKKRGYSRVSSEIYWNYRKGSLTFPRVLKAVALLGAEIPAITDLASIEALYQAMKQLDAEGIEYRTYFNDGLRLKSKEAVNYRETTGAEERCGTCRFYFGNRETGSVGFCSLVSGDIATEFVCDLFEKSDAFIDTGELESETAVTAAKREEDEKKKGKTKDKDDGKNKQYTIEKRGDQYCLISGTGETLGCHPTRAEAEAQEGAIKADMEKNVVRLSLADVAELCPECAEEMVAENITELKVAIGDEQGYDAEHKRRSVEDLVAWVGKVGYDSCLSKLRSQKLCGYLKTRADAKAKKASKEAGDAEGAQALENAAIMEKPGEGTVSQKEFQELKTLLETQAGELRDHKVEVGAKDERIALLERQNRETEVRKESDRLKVAGILKPAQEAVFRQLLGHFKCGEKIVEYHDGKKGDLAQDFVAFIETFPKPGVLAELSMANLERGVDDVASLTQSEAGQELVNKAKEYQAQHPSLPFDQCMKRARELNPDLAKQYAGTTS